MLCLIAENGTASFKIDKNAANRFIKHAIAQSAKATAPSATSQPQASTSQPTTYKVDTSTRFKHLSKEGQGGPSQAALDKIARRKHLAAESSSDEEDGLMVLDGDEAPEASTSKLTAEEDEVMVDESKSTSNQEKKKRPKMDPFVGERDEYETVTGLSSAACTGYDQPSSKSQKKQKKDNNDTGQFGMSSAFSGADVAFGTASGATGDSTSAQHTCEPTP